MKGSKAGQWALGIAVAAACTAALAQPKGGTDFGKREYESNCAACHGVDGKGNGPYNELLKRPASDLTTLARRNNGVFPIQRVYDVIDGGGTGHGTRDMPVWGREYRVRAGEHYMDTPYDPEVYVRTRILSLVDYLNRLQAW